MFLQLNEVIAVDSRFTLLFCEPNCRVIRSEFAPK